MTSSHPVAARAHHLWARVAAVLLLLLQAAPAPGRDDAAPPTPAARYTGLCERVQLGGVYEDGKTFVDALPRTTPEVILEEYARARNDPAFDLRAFVTARFDAPAEHATGYRSRPGVDIETHIDELWKVLTREPDQAAPHSSLLPLPHR